MKIISSFEVFHSLPNQIRDEKSVIFLSWFVRDEKSFFFLGLLHPGKKMLFLKRRVNKISRFNCQPNNVSIHKVWSLEDRQLGSNIKWNRAETRARTENYKSMKIAPSSAHIGRRKLCNMNHPLLIKFFFCWALYLVKRCWFSDEFFSRLNPFKIFFRPEWSASLTVALTPLGALLPISSFTFLSSS